MWPSFGPWVPHEPVVKRQTRTVRVGETLGDAARNRSVSTRTMPGIAVITQWDVKRHSEIVDAIESGDAAQASVAVRDHIAGATTVLVDGAA